MSSTDTGTPSGTPPAGPLPARASAARPSAARARGRTRKQKRFLLIAGGVGFLAAAVLLILFAFSQSVAYFYVPGDLQKTHVAPGTRIRLGGLVAAGSLQRQAGTTVSFTVTDTLSTVPVTYTGILPDLFREGQGVVAEGAMNAGGVFVADTVLAKHDETYMPKDVADRLKAQGVSLGGQETVR